MNNLGLAAATGVVFVGTLYPLFLELWNGAKITVGAPYFNQSFLPLFGVLMFAAGIGPFLSWKRARHRVVLRKVAVGVAVSAGLTFALALGFGLVDPAGLFGIFIATWLALATLMDLGARAGLPKAGPGTALRRLAGLPRSAWGLYLGHLGLALAAAGVVAVSVWKDEAIQTSALGDPVAVGPYAFTLEAVENTTGPNYQTSIATVTVTHEGDVVRVLTPERRFYPVEGQPTTEAGIATLWHGDIYAVLGDPDGRGGFVTRYYYNPGVPWMWLGGALMALAALISLTDRRLRIGAPTRRFAAEPAE